MKAEAQKFKLDIFNIDRMLTDLNLNAWITDLKIVNAQNNKNIKYQGFINTKCFRSF